jgi:hypothetical protein
MSACTLLAGTLEARRPLGRARQMLVNNIKMDLGEIGWGEMDWIGLAQGRECLTNYRAA